MNTAFLPSTRHSGFNPAALLPESVDNWRGRGNSLPPRALLFIIAKSTANAVVIFSVFTDAINYALRLAQ